MGKVEKRGNTGVQEGTPPDPWALPEFVDKTTPWHELSCCGKVWKVLWGYIGKVIMLLLLLYLFIVSLDFLGSAFKLLGGKAAGRIFRENQLFNNPICGLMIGVLVTVLVQSSSTSTSIVITMTAQGILDVRQAVYIIMGANIGTSVTNTIVSLGQAGNRDEFRRAFAGATVHDMFNWLSVLILLPIEAITNVLQRLTLLIVNSFHIATNKEAKKDILKVITKPFAKLVVQLDKNVIEEIALDVNHTEEHGSILKRFCKPKSKKVSDAVMSNAATVANTTTMANMTTMANTTTMATVTQNGTMMSDVLDKGHKGIPRCHAAFSYFPEMMSDEAVGAILLVIALLILCVCLVLIVKLLHSLLKGTIARVIRRVVNADFPGPLRFLTGYFAIFIGAILTIVVQSSSIFTSTLTPLVGVGVISIYRMFPLTLGANIGTTATGVLAALANSGQELKNGLQLALCHLFFNIFGILIWYPIPFMRKVPIGLAKQLGTTTGKYRWFALFYLFLVFFLLPLAVFALSIPGWYVLLGVAGPIFLFFVIIVIINILQSKRPGCLPAKLRSWDWLPLWMHSLKPMDQVISAIFFCKCCRSVTKARDDDIIEDGDLEKYAANGVANEGFAMGNGYPENENKVPIDSHNNDGFVGDVEDPKPSPVTTSMRL